MSSRKLIATKRWFHVSGSMENKCEQGKRKMRSCIKIKRVSK